MHVEKNKNVLPICSFGHIEQVLDWKADADIFNAPVLNQGDIKDEARQRSLQCIARVVVIFVVKVLSFFQVLACRLERRLANVHPSDESVQTPVSVGNQTNESPEDYVGPCLQKIQRLESMLAEISCRPAEIPAEKQHMLEESWDRIKSIEFDLKKTKRVSK